MERIWQHVFNDLLRVDPAEHAVLVTATPLSPSATREKMMEIMFEKFGVPAFYVGIQAVLSLYSAGRTTGVVLECGEGASHTAATFERYALPRGVLQMRPAGRDITEWFHKSLYNRGYVLATSAGLEIVREAKGQVCYVAQDYEAELVRAEESPATYVLPDCTEMVLGKARITASELLFQPRLGNIESLVCMNFWPSRLATAARRPGRICMPISFCLADRPCSTASRSASKRR
jgi:actin-related protein